LKELSQLKDYHLAVISQWILNINIPIVSIKKKYMLKNRFVICNPIFSSVGLFVEGAATVAALPTAQSPRNTPPAPPSLHLSSSLAVASFHHPTTTHTTQYHPNPQHHPSPLPNIWLCYLWHCCCHVMLLLSFSVVDVPSWCVVRFFPAHCCWLFTPLKGENKAPVCVFNLTNISRFHYFCQQQTKKTPSSHYGGRKSRPVFTLKCRRNIYFTNNTTKDVEYCQKL